MTNYHYEYWFHILCGTNTCTVPLQVQYSYWYCTNYPVEISFCVGVSKYINSYPGTMHRGTDTGTSTSTCNDLVVSLFL